MGEVDQTVFADELRKARYLMALPNWIEPCGRSVIEGLLCGCTLIVNDNIGFLHENIDVNNLQQLKIVAHSEQIFWDKVEAIL
jgi:hypothetical protein